MFRITNTFAILFIFTFSTTQAQETHIVDVAGGGDFSTIHEAVTAAADGDTIRVQPGQYAFTGSLGRIDIDKQLAIIGSGYIPSDEGGSELIDIAEDGYFSLGSSADETMIKGFRVQGAANFIQSESGTSDLRIEGNLLLENEANSNRHTVIFLQGDGDVVRSNIIMNTSRVAVDLQGSNTSISNNLFLNYESSGLSTHNGFIEIGGGTGVSISNNLFMNGSLKNAGHSIDNNNSGSPEIYSNGFIGGVNTGKIRDGGSAFITNNGFYDAGETRGLSTVEGNPNFVDFNADNAELTLETIDENDFDLRITGSSPWKDAGRSGPDYLDEDGSQNDIGLFGGSSPFDDLRGTPTVPVILNFQVEPSTVSPTGTITIQATSRIGGEN